jgi:hypothetical protein
MQQVSSKNDGILKGVNSIPSGGYSIKNWVLPFARYEKAEVKRFWH